jgi:rfaE bifunctional protein kinase chain/domain
LDPLISCIRRFKNKKILVLGDVILDKYIWGQLKRISPEAPVPVVAVFKKIFACRGAANVAANIRTLRGKVEPVGLVGIDSAQKSLLSLLARFGISFQGPLTHARRPTLQKIRIIGQIQQLLSLDYEQKDQIPSILETQIILFLAKTIPDSDAVVVSDYAKERIMKSLNALCVKKPLIVDPKPWNFSLYKGATLITPNAKEAYESAGLEESDLDINVLGKRLKRESQSNILITRSAMGMSLFCLHAAAKHIKTVAREVYDVTGIGDTVTAALALSSCAKIEDAPLLANHAA